ncbi:MAG: hypothetical protein B6U69_01395 [Thermofilum sp. ex4484_15]|nr:MAG: hypothetical protein B6U69_01395 [Thermofilum sp. ex4484_15]
MNLTLLKPLTFLKDVKVGSVKVNIVSKSGWTGELGAEFIGDIESLSKVWDLLVSEGAKPCGLGSRDSLRMEMGYCLYGYEIDEDINSIEAGYKVYSFKKLEYIRREDVWRSYIRGVSRVKMGLILKERDLYLGAELNYVPGGNEVGYVTSGSYSPILRVAIAQAYVSVSHALPGLDLEVKVRGKRYRCSLMDFPFVHK